MSAFQKEAPNNGENQKSDWRTDCVKPPKDNRIQTEVSIFLWLSFLS